MAGQRKVEDPLTEMQAAVLYGIHDIRMAGLPKPVPGAGEVLLKLSLIHI